MAGLRWAAATPMAAAQLMTAWGYLRAAAFALTTASLGGVFWRRVKRRKGSRAAGWERTTRALRLALGRKGLDVVAPLQLRWYNDVAPESAKIAVMSGSAVKESALVILVGNSRALWPKFCAAHDTDPTIGDAENPLDTYVAREVERAVRALDDATASSAASTDDAEKSRRHRVFYAHETRPGRLVAIQRMAHVAGVAHLDERCHLSIHPRLGPWLALRVVVVFDDVLGPPDTSKPTPPVNPLASDAGRRQRVDNAFDAALAGYERPEGVDEENQWRRWVAVRDAVEPEHRRRYYDDQVLYHYNAGISGARANRGGDGARSRDRMNERERIRAGMRGFENKA